MPRRPYHHGHLRQALIDTALALATECGHEEFSLREVARRIGVSSGAPFRHFADRSQLMAAIAEQATVQLRIRAERDQHTATDHPMARLKVLGRSFLGWALSHPAQFRIVSSRRLFSFDQAPGLQRHFDAIRDLTLQLIRQAQSSGHLDAHVPAADLALQLRATAYGLARMLIDGQLPQWRVPGPAAHQHLVTLLDRCIDGLATAAPSGVAPMPATSTAPLHYARHPSPVGDILVVCDDEGRLLALDFADHEDRMRDLLRRQWGAVQLQPGPLPPAVGAALDAYFAGDLRALDALPTLARGTPFQAAVWQALRDIPPGETESYGDLARRLGKPGASRAVGLANGANPLALIVPCHRVIGANGRLTGYSGGLPRKQWLLAHEARCATDGLRLR